MTDGAGEKETGMQANVNVVKQEEAGFPDEAEMEQMRHALDAFERALGDMAPDCRVTLTYQPGKATTESPS